MGVPPPKKREIPCDCPTWLGASDAFHQFCLKKEENFD